MDIRFRLPDGTTVPLKEWVEHNFTKEEIQAMSVQVAEAIRRQLDATGSNTSSIYNTKQC